MMLVPEKTGPVRGSFIEMHPDKRPCWSCDAEIEDQYSCSHCSVIQTFLKETDYFRCFELSYHLDIDLKLLEKQYYKMSRKFHPDYYQQKSTEEQAISLENTALLTRAYRTLKDPLERVAYLICLVEGDENIPTEAPADLFEEIFEIQETLEEIRRCNEEHSEQKTALIQSLKHALERMEHYQAEEKKALEALSCEWDRLESSRQQESFSDLQRGCIMKMKHILSHRAYVDRIVGDLRKSLVSNP